MRPGPPSATRNIFKAVSVRVSSRPHGDVSPHTHCANRQSSRCVTHGSRSQLEHILCSHVRHFLLVVKNVRQTSHFHRTFCRGSLYTRCAGCPKRECSFPISPICLSVLVACLAWLSFSMVLPVELSCCADAAGRPLWNAEASLDWAVKEDVFVDSSGIIAVEYGFFKMRSRIGVLLYLTFQQARCNFMNLWNYRPRDGVRRSSPHQIFVGRHRYLRRQIRKPDRSFTGTS